MPNDRFPTIEEQAKVHQDGLKFRLAMAHEMADMANAKMVEVAIEDIRVAPAADYCRPKKDTTSDTVIDVLKKLRGGIKSFLDGI